MVLISVLNPQVTKVVRKLILSDDTLREYMEKFNREINRGLSIGACDEAVIKSFVTHINKLPTGNEEGAFIALEFVSQTIRILLVNMIAKECTVTCKMCDIPNKLMTGKSEKLFDFLAGCVADFMRGLKLKMLRIPLGVTFGFPIEQISLQDCRLVRWTKGFQCDDMIGENVCLKLKNALRKYPELKRVFVIGILNDTVSAVLARAWQDPGCKIGVVVGQGASCCYAEKVSRISKYETENYAARDVYINLESSNFGDDGCLDGVRCSFDIQVDQTSKNPGEQINEKMISMVYLGEITRLAIVECIQQKIILKGVLTPKMATFNTFQSKHMSQIESDPEDKHQGCRTTLREFGYDKVSDLDCTQIQFICRCVSRRAAHLMAAQLSTLINRINDPEITIAADGPMIRNYPRFEWYMTKKIKELRNEDCNVIKAEENDLGRGAAVMAAVFGEEIMNKEEKLRRLPGFPADQCHFKKIGKFLNPDCGMRHPCDAANSTKIQKPMRAKSKDLLM